MNNIFDLANLGSHIIGGQEKYPVAKPLERIESINPFSGEVLWVGEAADNNTVDAAVAAARAAFPDWSKRGFAERHQLLSRFVELVQKNANDLTCLIATEAGKPLWESKLEVNSLVTKLGASVDAYKNRVAESDREVKGLRSRTRFLPHGVMAVLGPFNFPASMANSHVMPALLAGNTVVLKPSELTPVIGLIVSRLWQEAGLPPGVMNCITGARKTGEHLVTHKDIDGVLLVGSCAAGMSIRKMLVDSPQKIVALEMGGNSPLVIWDYENLDATVHIIIQSAFMSGGQRCSAARRLLVREDDSVLIPRLIEVLKKLRIGDFKSTPEPYYGPLIRPVAANGVIRRVKELVSGGATVLLEPLQQGPIGTVIAPGLLDVSNCSNDRDEEIFGPVLKIRRYSKFEEAITMANDTKFGLAAGIVCRDKERFDEFFDSVKAGIVNWNQQLTGATTLAPFGGVKHSGNFRPAGFLSADYCSYAIASFEVDKPKLPEPTSDRHNLLNEATQCMSLGRQFYQSLDDTLKTTIAGSGGFSEHVQTAPVGLPESHFTRQQSRLGVIHAFFDVTLQIFRDVIAGKHSPSLSQMLLNDVPQNYGVKFHENLPAEVWTTPHFFRTDEAKDGHILEIQCPGSGWGDLQLLSNIYLRNGICSSALTRYQPSAVVAKEIVRLCGNAQPSVLHLLDNASNPVSMRYLMATTQPPLRYWGYEKSVRNSECEFVRSHSFFGLVAENLFKIRVRDAIDGRVKFDLPPLLVFDQKIPLCLPFLPETKDLFTDEIRNMLAFSYPVTEAGFLDIDGLWVTLEGFLKRPPSKRGYFLKYAGCDVSLNWGSRAVYRLSESKAKATEHLKTAAADARRGRIWLIQPEISEKETVAYFNKKSGERIQAEQTAKYSCFYGPTSLIGIRTMHRNHPKVHGQEDTIIGVAVPGYFDETKSSGR